LAFALVGMFFTRYEAIPFAMAVGVCVALNILCNKKEDRYWAQGNLKERYYYIEGSFFLLFTPMAYGVFLWILFNLVITGNPLYFLNSVYSNVSQSMFSQVNGSFVDILWYVLERTAPFIPLFLSVILMRIAQNQLRRFDLAALTVLVGALIAFHYVMLWNGSSFGWLRFFSYCLPICMAWIPYELSTCKEKFLKTSKCVFLLALVLSMIFCTGALKNPNLAKEEQNLTISTDSYQIADYINDHLSEDTVLMDSFLTNGIILNVEHVDHLVVSSSLRFNACVADPLHSGINYILVPDPKGVGSLDAINIAYKKLYNEGADWCELEAEFDGFKLFRVLN